MKTKWIPLGVAIALLAAWMVPAWGQDVPPAIRLLLIDETKTFTSTMRVAATVGALRQVGMFDITIRLSETDNSYADPLSGVAPDPVQEPFDLVLIFPRGLDTQTDVSIWLVSDALSRVPPSVRMGVDVISGIVDQVFAGAGETVDESDDLWPALFWSLYAQNGWVR